MKSKNNIALIIVDMQDFFLKNFYKDKVKKLVGNQSKVISFCVKENIPIFLLEYATRGKTIKALRDIAKDSSTIIKENNSGFRDTKLDEILKMFGTKSIILMGINGSGCVQDTAIGAIKRNYKIMTSEDIIASNTKRDCNLSTSKKWYSKNGKFFESSDNLIEYINK